QQQRVLVPHTPEEYRLHSTLRRFFDSALNTHRILHSSADIGTNFGRLEVLTDSYIAAFNEDNESDTDAYEDEIAQAVFEISDGLQGFITNLQANIETRFAAVSSISAKRKQNEFYLDATHAPWAGHWRMESYLLRELIPAVSAQFGLDGTRLGISGHSMGGHGALTLALRHPGRFASVSAFAPICAPSQCPWGHKAFTGYFGQDESVWGDHDASVLMARQEGAPYPGGLLIDQGLADKFLAEQLHPEAFEAACAAVGQPLTLRRHAGYDHGYYFIASVVDDHVAHHARALVPALSGG
ncbi:MAG: hypothetical protein RJB37_2074, partial [Pseudomonadota bacterium]